MAVILENCWLGAITSRSCSPWKNYVLSFQDKIWSQTFETINIDLQNRYQAELELVRCSNGLVMSSTGKVRFPSQEALMQFLMEWS